MSSTVEVPIRKSISAVICTRNEGVRIAKCLEGLLWCDEILVIDRFSTDDTEEIACRYAKVQFIQRDEWVNSNMNFGLEAAKGDWTIRMDADEVVSPEMAEEILLMLANDNPEYGGYLAPNRVFFFGKWIQFGVAYDHRFAKVRPGYGFRKVLFRKGTARFECLKQHEDFVTEGKYGILKGHYDHFSHPTVSRWIEKMNWYTDIDTGLTDVLAPNFKLPHPAKTLIALIKIFFDLYIMRKGYKDGVYGFITCSLNTFYVLVERCKIWEKHYRAARPDQIVKY